MSTTIQTEEIGLFKKPPLLLAILRPVLKSIAMGSVISTIAANTVSLLGKSSVFEAWLVGAMIGCAMGSFLDFGELWGLRAVHVVLADPDGHYPRAVIHTPNQDGVVRLRFIFPFRLIEIDGAVRVFIFRQSLSQYFSNRSLKRVTQFVCLMLCVEGGLIWCSVASLARLDTGFFNKESEVNSLLLGPACALALVGFIELLWEISHSTSQKSTSVTDA